MLRLLTVFLLFFALCNAVQIPRNYTSSCSAVTCAKSGASCTGDFYQLNVSFCQNLYTSFKNPTGCCPMGLYCLGNGTSLTCMKDSVGLSCNSHTDCLGSRTGTNYTQCVNSKCQIIYGAGDACSANDQCHSNNCTGDICSGIGVNGNCTAAQPAGSNIAICNTNLYCKKNGLSIYNYTCTPVLASEAACSAVPAGTPCMAGEWCTNEKCTKVGTVAAKGNCSSSNVITPGSVDTYLCASGLAANEASGLCVTGKAYTLTTCTNDSQCASVDKDSLCQCANNGKGYCSASAYNASAEPDTTQVSAGVSLLQCLAKSNCYYNYMSPDGMQYANNDPNSCAVKNCNSYLKKFNSAPCSTEKMEGSCSYLPYCSGFPVWAIIVIVVVAILLVLAVVFVIFLVLRKRRDYSSI